jgi:hypothetical protein
MFNIPILFTVFNRPDTASIVFDRIREIKPKQLFLAADGPRSNRVDDIKSCEKVKEVISKVDWDCEVSTLFRKDNLGSGKAISEAITWFFSRVEMGIILEDDCLPDVSFFSFCKETLEYYKDENKVMHISGSNLQCGLERGVGSYYLSNLSTTWGWATWRRAWEKYSFDFFGDTDEEIAAVLHGTVLNREDVIHFMKEFHYTKTKFVDAWDYQWVYTLLKLGGICVTPQYNLVRNIGFNSQGTHTFTSPYWYKYLVDRPINNVVHVDGLKINNKADLFYLALIMGRRTIETMYMKLKYRIGSNS